MRAPALWPGDARQRARLCGWLGRFALAGVLLVTCVWGWAGYQGGSTRLAISDLWSLCGTSGR